MRNITDIFFDLDHTLWDFEKNSALTFQKILAENEVAVPRAVPRDNNSTSVHSRMHRTKTHHTYIHTSGKVRNMIRKF